MRDEPQPGTSRGTKRRATTPETRRPMQGTGEVMGSNSEATIYKRVVQLSLDGSSPDEQQAEGKRISNSSEEFMDTSEEGPFNPEIENSDDNECDLITGKGEHRNSAERSRTQVDRPIVTHHFNREQQQPSTSRQRFLTPKEKGTKATQHVERGKARVLEIPGMINSINNLESNNVDRYTGDLILSVIVDESYSAIATHVDENLHRQIKEGCYVDFSKLLPKDRVSAEEDVRMEMVNKGGLSYWVPLSERNNSAISSIAKWEQAFRIFLKIYVEGNPSRAEELIQYNYIIHEASADYPWESVYSYDREFRLHMSKFPNRNWGIILQQAWTLKMNHSNHSGVARVDTNQGGSPGFSRNKLCWKFNLGPCTYGMSCKFEHRCALCGKFGHGVVNCQRAKSQDIIDFDYKTGERWRRSSSNGFHRRREEGNERRNDKFHFYKKDQQSRKDKDKGKE